MKAYDVIIIGAGPAGITASVYAARKNLNTIVITKDIGGQTAWSGDIENYTGYQFITGPELAAKFEDHMKRYGISLEESEAVTEVGKKEDSVIVKTGKGSYTAKAAIIASGKRTRSLGVPGEHEFKNKGLTYCATCDAPLFNGRDVAVIGGGNSALDAGLQLINIAKFVYMINITSSLSGDAIMRDKVMASGKVKVFNNSRVTEVVGDKMVNSIKVTTPDGEKTLPVTGVFVEIGLIPNSEIAPGVEKNKNGEIKVTPYNETNIPGIFAAGDVTSVPEKQIIIAAGEGAKASLGVFRYLATRR